MPGWCPRVFVIPAQHLSMPPISWTFQISPLGKQSLDLMLIGSFGVCGWDGGWTILALLWLNQKAKSRLTTDSAAQPMKLLLHGVLNAHGFPWLWMVDSARWSRSDLARSMGKPWWGLRARICPVLRYVKRHGNLFCTMSEFWRGRMYLCWYCWQNLLRWYIMHMQNWPIICFMPESGLGIDVLWPPVCIHTRPYSLQYSRHLLQAYYRFVILFSFHFCKVRKSELCTTWDMYGTWILEHVFEHM
jgi:hypothetical protein